jgi:hypothetical protein
MSLYTNVHGLPDAFVNAVLNDPYQGGGDISATRLIDSPRRRTLHKAHKDSVVEDVSERVWSVMGQAVHAVLERAQTSALVEERLFAQVSGWSLSGQFDRMHLADKTLQDWKVCSVYKYLGDESWTRQLNVLRWLAHQNGYEVDRLQVVAIFRDWKRAESQRRDDYPKQAIQVIDVPAWPLEDCENYIKNRLSLHQRSEAGEEIECSEEERWYTGTTYALMKEGGKRAKRVVPILSDLGEIPPGHYAQERPGRNRRCEEYCEVAPFCAQWQQLKASQPPGDEPNDVDF